VPSRLKPFSGATLKKTLAKTKNPNNNKNNSRLIFPGEITVGLPLNLLLRNSWHPRWQAFITRKDPLAQTSQCKAAIIDLHDQKF